MSEWKTGDRDRRMNENDHEILNRLGGIEVQIATLSSESRSSHKAFRDFEAETKRLNERIVSTVYGNGKEGLTTKINELGAIKENLLNHSRSDSKWFLGIVGLLMTILGWTIFKH